MKTNHSLPHLRDIISKYELNANKSLGQNFLLDLNITDKIVKFAGGYNLKDKTVIEIGPGPGALTQSILRFGAKKLICIEKDPRCVAALNDYLAPIYPNLSILEIDALKIEIASILDKGEKAVIISNLPYNISTKLLNKWLDELSRIDKMTLMFQKEVADRIISKNGNKSFGRLSVISQWLCDIEKNFDLPPEAFIPPPKVSSSVVSFEPKQKPEYKANAEKLRRLCSIIFAQRRKTLRSTLKKLNLDNDVIENELNIDMGLRPEQLNIEQLCALSNQI